MWVWVFSFLRPCFLAKFFGYRALSCAPFKYSNHHPKEFHLCCPPKKILIILCALKMISCHDTKDILCQESVVDIISTFTVHSSPSALAITQRFLCKVISCHYFCHGRRIDWERGTIAMGKVFATMIVPVVDIYNWKDDSAFCCIFHMTFNSFWVFYTILLPHISAMTLKSKTYK